MTILALDNSVSSALKSGSIFNQLQMKKTNRSLPTRINLRKRASGSNAILTPMNLTTVNSAFLSGLFADVAQASSTETSCHEILQPSTKKSRISKSKSLARCGRSFMTLSAVQDELAEEAAADLIVSMIPDSPVQASTSYFTDRQDSLQYQLDCVCSCSSADITSGNKDSDKDTKLAFPFLPPAVSNPSCDNKQLTRVVSDLQSSVSENSEQGESYGWFVEMEDEQSLHSAERVVDPYATTTSATTTATTHGLAFQATTAPKANNYDAEVEWAKAADTVDDVLGDFF